MGEWGEIAVKVAEIVAAGATIYGIIEVRTARSKKQKAEAEAAAQKQRDQAAAAAADSRRVMHEKIDRLDRDFGGIQVQMAAAQIEAARNFVTKSEFAAYSERMAKAIEGIGDRLFEVVSRGKQ